MRTVAPRLDNCEEFTAGEDDLDLQPLTAAIYVCPVHGPVTLVRWTFTPEERQAIADGGDVLIWVPGTVVPIHSVSVLPEGTTAVECKDVDPGESEVDPE